MLEELRIQATHDLYTLMVLELEKMIKLIRAVFSEKTDVSNWIFSFFYRCDLENKIKVNKI